MSMKKVMVLFTVVLFISSGKLLAQKKPFTIADLYKIHYVGAPVVSPNGDRVAFTVANYNMKKGESNTNIYVMDTDGKNLKKITDNKKSNYNPLWTSNGKTVYYVSTESKIPQIYSYSFVSGKSKKITDFSMGVSAPVLSPDNKLIAFA